jgi:ATP-dependent Clp protease ATP-binding subunit ClpA
MSEKVAEKELLSQLHEVGIEAARARFSPEFFNRIDSVSTFQALHKRHLLKIVQLELDKLTANVPFQVILSSGAKREILRQSLQDIGTKKGSFGFSTSNSMSDFATFGARRLKRVIREVLLVPLSRLRNSIESPNSDTVINVGHGASGFRFFARTLEHARAASAAR